MFNSAYLPLFTTDKKNLIVYGGSGSGKSEFVARMLLIFLMSRERYNILAARKVQESLRFSVFNLFQKIIISNGLEDLFTINMARMIITHKKTQNQILCRGIDNPEKIKSITFKNGDLNMVWGEEATEFNQEDIEQLNIRLRGKSLYPLQMLITFNPISANHWIKIKYFDNYNPDDTFILKTTHKDNKFLHDDYHDKMENYKNTDIFFYQVYCLGEWGVTDSDATIIKISDAMIARNNNVIPEGQFDLGIDVAGMGKDEATIYMRKGLKVIDYAILKISEPIDIAKAAVSMIMNNRRDDRDLVRIKVDVTGEGAGVVSHINQFNLPNVKTYKISFNNPANNSKKYNSAATEMYFELKYILPTIQIPNDELLIAQLTTRKYNFDTKTRYQIEDKKSYKKRFGSSPDRADGLALCFYEPRNKDMFEVDVKIW